jgi:hypothetical protein
LKGGHDWIRTSDLFRVNQILNRNSLILGASAAPISIQRHPKFSFSTIVSTIKTQKEKVWEKVWNARYRRHWTGLSSLLSPWLLKGVDSEHGKHDSQTFSSKDPDRAFPVFHLPLDCQRAVSCARLAWCPCGWVD